MIWAMLSSELAKVRGRRGTFWTAIGLPLLVSIVTLVVLLVLKDAKPESYESGKNALDIFATSGLFVLLGVSLVGAQEGAYDVQQGTFRYLLMTGRSKSELYLLRVAVMLIVALLVALPSVALGLAASLLLPHAVDHKALELSDAALFAWTMLLIGFVYGLVAMSVGALLRSSGAAIAVSLGLNFIGLQLLALVEQVDDSLGKLMLPNAMATLSGDKAGDSIAIAALVVLVWLGAIVALGGFRTTRAEY